RRCEREDKSCRHVWKCFCPPDNAKRRVTYGKAIDDWSSGKRCLCYRKRALRRRASPSPRFAMQPCRLGCWVESCPRYRRHTSSMSDLTVEGCSNTECLVLWLWLFPAPVTAFQPEST